MTTRGEGRARRALPLLLLTAVLAAACRDDGDTARATRETVAPNVSRWRVTPRGIGPVQVGMTLDEANAVVAGRLASEEPLDSTCDFVMLRGTDSRVAFMVVAGRIARVDVRDSVVMTAEGARVGDEERRLHQLYEGRMTSEPHHYVQGGHYLIVSPRERGDTSHLLLFETDGRRVTEYRAGRLPEVEWVEGCS